jgi:hypothetical protein
VTSHRDDSERLAVDLDSFITEHRGCGDLDTGMTNTDPERVWLTCSCGGRIERLASPAHGTAMN